MALAVVFACSSPAGESCYPGDYQVCDCPGGGHGMAQCVRNGGDYGACVCKVAVDGGGDADTDAPNASRTMDDAGDAGDAAASGDGGASVPLAFMAPCSNNAQCSTGLCFAYNAKGPHCSKACSIDSDCPAPSPGCNMMKVCKAP